MRGLVILVLLAELARSAQQGGPLNCAISQECRQKGIDAAERGDFEAFHTLAWRAAQLGPPNDAGLMYLLARAQSLSGRPHDALVMLGRLADRGITLGEAETSDDFRRARSLPQWPDVLKRIHIAAGRAVMPSAVTEATIESAPTPEAARLATSAADAIPLPAGTLAPLALTYDAVSRRFVFADERSDTLKIIDELSGKVVDLVSRRWAGLYRTAAIAIDPRRGDLWAAGTHDDDPDRIARSAIHRLQLVSGRLLYTVPLPAESGAARFADIAVTQGSVFVLDAEGRRVLGLAPGAKSLGLRMTVRGVQHLTSLAPAGDGVIYVAHAEGLLRLNVTARSSTSVGAAKEVNLRGLERIRWGNGSLVGIQRRLDGRMVAVRIPLNRGGTIATSLDILDDAASSAASVVGHTFYYLGVAPRGGTVLRRLHVP